jgi:hypothetical protein
VTLLLEVSVSSVRALMCSLVAVAATAGLTGCGSSTDDDPGDSWGTVDDSGSGPAAGAGNGLASGTPCVANGSVPGPSFEDQPFGPNLVVCRYAVQGSVFRVGLFAEGATPDLAYPGANALILEWNLDQPVGGRLLLNQGGYPRGRAYFADGTECELGYFGPRPEAHAPFVILEQGEIRSGQLLNWDFIVEGQPCSSPTTPLEPEAPVCSPANLQACAASGGGGAASALTATDARKMQGSLRLRPVAAPATSGGGGGGGGGGGNCEACAANNPYMAGCMQAGAQHDCFCASAYLKKCCGDASWVEDAQTATSLGPACAL